MPQIPTKPMEARKVIDAGMPKNISEVDRAALQKKWDDAAIKRRDEIAAANKVPTEASVTLKYQLKKFGRWFNAYAIDKKGKATPLLNGPSLLSSAIDALTDRMSDDGLKA